MARHFLRLKVALVGSAFRRGWQHAVGLAAGLLFGLPFALLVAAGLALAARTEAGPALLVLAFAGLAVAWTLAPVLFFGLDETLDPARLQLLPLSRRQLLVGLTVAAAVGIPAVASLAVLLAGLAYPRGVAGLAVAAVAVAAQFLACLWAGRALATSLSATLRSRKGRDLAAGAAMLTGLAVAGAGQVPNLLAGTLAGDGAAARLTAALDGVAGVVALTPPGWAAGAIVAARDGRMLAALALLAGSVALAAALGWAWQAALARALTQPGTAASGKSRDQGLFHASLKWLPRGHLGAAVARELRYLLRVPQLRIGLALLVAFGVALVVAAAVVGSLSRPEVVYAPALLVVVQGFQAVNLFGHDRGAVWLLVASSPSYRTDLAGKAIAHGMATLAVAVPASVALAGLTGAWGHVVPAVLLSAALQLSALGVGTVASVLAPHPLPEGASNMWGSSAGMGCATMLLQAAAFALQGVLLAPAAGAVAAAYFLAPSWLPLAGALAAAYGAAIWGAGTVLAAARLHTHAPEFVAALSADPAR